MRRPNERGRELDSGLQPLVRTAGQKRHTDLLRWADVLANGGEIFFFWGEIINWKVIATKFGEVVMHDETSIR